ncbi:MAG TPA: antibiotic biosynthesis monooxygenase [Kofleriaceae bacterium]|nr:antibiotic biosynthesis monooxygenase [Kofleriaceae bacterium]
MFAVIYRWKLVPGREALFEEGWRAGTEAIANELGGWGSRLHRGEDGYVVAYAQWPDRATWERAMQRRMHHSDDAARDKYRSAFEPGSFETLFAGEVIADLLALRRG